MTHQIDTVFVDGTPVVKSAVRNVMKTIVPYADTRADIEAATLANTVEAVYTEGRIWNKVTAASQRAPSQIISSANGLWFEKQPTADELGQVNLIPSSVGLSTGLHSISNGNEYVTYTTAGRKWVRELIWVEDTPKAAGQTISPSYTGFSILGANAYGAIVIGTNFGGSYNPAAGLVAGSTVKVGFRIPAREFIEAGMRIGVPMCFSVLETIGGVNDFTFNGFTVLECSAVGNFPATTVLNSATTILTGSNVTERICKFTPGTSLNGVEIILTYTVGNNTASWNYFTLIAPQLNRGNTVLNRVRVSKEVESLRCLKYYWDSRANGAGYIRENSNNPQFSSIPAGTFTNLAVGELPKAMHNTGGPLPVITISNLEGTTGSISNCGGGRTTVSSLPITGAVLIGSQTVKTYAITAASTTFANGAWLGWHVNANAMGNLS